jgi:hypothetical protein
MVKAGKQHLRLASLAVNQTQKIRAGQTNLSPTLTLQSNVTTLSNAIVPHSSSLYTQNDDHEDGSRSCSFRNNCFELAQFPNCSLRKSTHPFSIVWSIVVPDKDLASSGMTIALSALCMMNEAGEHPLKSSY